MRTAPVMSVGIADTEDVKGVYDIKSDINFINPYGATMDVGAACQELALKVNSIRTQR